MRDAKIAMEELRRCAGEADVIMIDDVHRRHVFDTIEQVMASPEQYEKSFYDYVVQKGFSNSLFIGTKKSSAAKGVIKERVGGLFIRFCRWLQECKSIRGRKWSF